MRHDWTLLCREALEHNSGEADLGNVFTTLEIYSPFRRLEESETVLFDPPAVLASHWSAEFANERRVHSATIQLLAPGGDRVLWQEEMYFDFRGRTTFLLIFILPSMPFVGSGTYEYNVLLSEYALIGEWGRACLGISEWVGR